MYIYVCDQIADTDCLHCFHAFHVDLQAIAMVLSDGRLAVISCLEEDDWEVTVETIAASGKPEGPDGLPACASELSMDCIVLPRGLDLQGSRCVAFRVALVCEAWSS